MALKVTGTEVVSNSRVLSNVGSASGRYFSMHGNATSTGTVIDMRIGCQTKVLGAATTFTVSNLSIGRSVMLSIDVTTSGYDITWPTSVEWQQDTEPTWTGARYWVVNLTCWSSSIIRATATSWSG
jgi:hypothetical protein